MLKRMSRLEQFSKKKDRFAKKKGIPRELEFRYYLNQSKHENFNEKFNSFDQPLFRKPTPKAPVRLELKALRIDLYNY